MVLFSSIPGSNNCSEIEADEEIRDCLSLERKDECESTCGKGVGTPSGKCTWKDNARYGLFYMLYMYIVIHFSFFRSTVNLFAPLCSVIRHLQCSQIQFRIVRL